MSWKAFFFDFNRISISTALLRENFRRFWVIPALSFLCYFLSGPFLFLLRYPLSAGGYHNNNPYLIIRTLHGANAGFIMLHILVPVIACVAVFRYLQQPGTVVTAHTLPFSRATLFRTSFLSGFLMTALPILATALIFLFIKTPIYVDVPTDSFEEVRLPLFTRVIAHPQFPAEHPGGVYDAFSAGAILEWLFAALLISLFIYSIAVFSGVVTGNSILHFGFALWFHLLAPMLWLCLSFYFGLFFFGFSESGSMGEIYRYMSPLFLQISSASFSPFWAFFFAAEAIFIALLSQWFYSRRPLERTGDALAFHFMRPVVCSLIAFILMTLFGLYFKEVIALRNSLVFLGICAGALLGFLTGRMVVMKTLQIFNRKTALSFVAFLTACGLFSASLAFDVYGYENRIPKLSSIRSARFSAEEIFKNGNYNLRFDEKVFNVSDDPELISYVREIHREILTKKELFLNDLPSIAQLRLSYVQKNGWTACRSYQLPYEFLYSSQALRSYYQSPQRRQSIKNSFEAFPDITLAQLYHHDSDGSSHLSLYPNEYDLDGFLEAVKQDFLTMSYAQSILNAPTLMQADLSCENQDLHAFISVTPQMSHTLKWLENQGCSNPLKEALYLTAAILITPESSIEEEKTEEEKTIAYETTSSDESFTDVFLSDTPKLWDGDSAYQYDFTTQSLKPVSLKELSERSDKSFLVTEPEDILQLLCHAETSNPASLEKYRLTVLSKTESLALYRILSRSPLFLMKGALQAEDFDLSVSEKLDGFLHSAL